jgi:integrase
VNAANPADAAAVPRGRAGNGERAIRQAVDALVAVVPQLDPVVARAAVVRVTSRTRSRRMITEHLAEHPTALVDGDSNAPAPVARLISELIAAGLEGVALPRCLDCAQQKPLVRGVPGGKVCNGCLKRRRPAEICSRCGKLEPRATRDPNGQPVCAACHRRTYIRPVDRCAVCGVNRSYRTRKRICTQCRQRPHSTCDTCGQPAAIPPAGEPARCSHCRLGRAEPCEGCGEPTIGRTRQGQPQCERCYKRPVGTCGRCGRVRTIVRLAVDGDPDLCALCWRGPTVACENCGNVRPCRGERRGRMLCGSCAPVRPQECAHCGRARRPAAHWPEGPVCGSCYQRALAAKDTCPQCAQTRRLMRYPGYERPVCRECAGAPAHNLCGRCGAEDAPYARGLCARCVLHDRLTELLGDQPKRVRLGLDGLFDELAAARSAKDMLKWLGRSSAVPLLGRIARSELPCTHETLDRYAPDPAVRRLEHMLVATGALPTRDPALARLERWTEDFLVDHDGEPVLRTFAHWVVLRRYRRKSQRAPLKDGVLSRAKVELRSAGSFLHWLAERNRTLEDCAQADVDAWLAGERADRYIARSFVRFAMAQKLMPRLDFPAGQRGGPCPPVITEELVELAHRLLHDPELSARDRVAGVLIAVFAQPVSRVARLTVDDLTVDGENVAIRFGDTAISMPEPVARDIRELLDQLAELSPSVIRRYQWLFPGAVPSRPIGELVLSRRMKRIGVDCRDTRRAALLELAGRLPAAIVADLLGVHITTATQWAQIAGRPWGDYPALRAQRSRRG